MPGLVVRTSQTFRKAMRNAASLWDGDTGLAQIDQRLESSQKIEAQQTVDWAFRWKLVTGHREAAKCPFEDPELRDDDDGNELLAAGGQRLPEDR